MNRRCTMADPVSDSAHRRAQIIADQALREAAAAPTNWRAARKRRPYSTWSNPTALRGQPPAEPTAAVAGASDERNTKK